MDAVTDTRTKGRMPPNTKPGVILWVQQNLFSSLTNTLLTLGAGYLLYIIVPGFIQWAIIDASWALGDRTLCDSNPDGACWTFIRVRFTQIIFGLYFAANPDDLWRPILMFAAAAALITWLLLPKTPSKKWVALFTVFVFPVLSYGIVEGSMFGLPVAQTSQWGGFMLTFMLASVGIVAALPLGILLALGRRSTMPFIRTVCVIFIEFWRGTPLITILFMASVMLPLFFPSEVDFDKVLRAMIGITMFQSAYTAEAIRGGLQAVPKGQIEAASSLGLGYWKSMFFIVLPQALKISIPGIVNTFIELFKDTSLVAIIGLLDLLNMANGVSRSIEWKGYDLEAYIVAAFIFWMCCFAMSRYSLHLEKKLDTGHRNST